MNNQEYFELKYLEETNMIFQDLLQINQFYNVNLFQKNNNFNDLYEFIISITEFDEIEELNSEDELLLSD